MRLYEDEKLSYYVALRIPDEALVDHPGTPALDGEDTPTELLHFLERVQVSEEIVLINTLR